MPLTRKPRVQISEEGTAQGKVSDINFVGDSTTAAVSGDTATVTSTGGTGTGPTLGEALALSTAQAMP